MNAEIDGLEELRKKFGALGVEVEAKALDGLKAAGLNIIADAQTNLRNNKTNTFGRLSNSGKVQAINDGIGVDVGFFSEEQTDGYASHVEYGTRGYPARKRIPPPGALAMWAKKKLRLKDDEAEARGWAIAKRIFKFGTRPQPFFNPAVQKNVHEITKAITTAVRHYIDNYRNR